MPWRHPLKEGWVEFPKSISFTAPPPFTSSNRRPATVPAAG